MLLTHVIWQTDLKPLSGTNAKNGAIPFLSLGRCIQVMQGVTKQVSGWGGVYSALVHVVFVLWVCLRETWVVFRDDPQYNVMKYLVFGTISVVYYQSYKLLFLKPISMVYTLIWRTPRYSLEPALKESIALASSL